MSMEPVQPSTSSEEINGCVLADRHFLNKEFKAVTYHSAVMLLDCT